MAIAAKLAAAIATQDSDYAGHNSATRGRFNGRGVNLAHDLELIGEPAEDVLEIKSGACGIVLPVEDTKKRAGSRILAGREHARPPVARLLLWPDAVAAQARHECEGLPLRQHHPALAAGDRAGLHAGEQKRAAVGMLVPGSDDRPALACFFVNLSSRLIAFSAHLVPI